MAEEIGILDLATGPDGKINMASYRMGLSVIWLKMILNTICRRLVKRKYSEFLRIFSACLPSFIFCRRLQTTLTRLTVAFHPQCFAALWVIFRIDCCELIRDTQNLR